MILGLVVIDSALSFMWRWEGGSEVPFHFDEPASPLWSVSSFHCGCKTLCRINRERTRGSFVRTRVTMLFMTVKVL